MPAVRQERRQGMEYLSARRVHDRDIERRSAYCRYPPQMTIIRIAEDNHAFLVPRTRTNFRRRLAQRLRGTTGRVRLLLLASNAKRQEPAVGRPKRIKRVLCAGQMARLQRIEVANPYAAFWPCVNEG